MKNPTYATEAIVLARRNFGEADRILTVFSKHYGKLRVLAKGIRRPTSRKRGSLELFNLAKLFIASGKNLDIITEAEVKNSFSSFRKDLTKVSVAYHLAEIADRLTVENQDHERIFDLLVDAFGEIGKLGYWELFSFIQSFKVKVLEELGFLERGKPTPKNLDLYIEDLIGRELRTKRFLHAVEGKI